MNGIDNIPDPLARLFYEGAQQGRLLLPRCADCGKTHWYPRPICPHCWKANVSLAPAVGGGTVYSLTRFRQQDGSSRTLAYIQLQEGITLLSRIVEDDGTVTIGHRVHVTFIHQEVGREAFSLPCFRALKS